MKLKTISLFITDSYFTERYFTSGTEYLRAIQESDLTMRAGNIDSRNYLLVHGTADELVHQQHSLIFTKALIDLGIGFRHQVIAFLRNILLRFLLH